VTACFGDPSYLSPEQVEGRAVDQRSNIYSLGALFQYLLTGAPPFAGDTAAVLQQQLNSQPPAPSTVRPGISAEVDRIVFEGARKKAAVVDI